MQSSQIEQTLRGMIEEQQRRERAEKEAARTGSWLSRFGRNRQPKKKKSATASARKNSRRGDFVVAALGISLGFGCAVFPWYIFFNQEKFGVRAMRFAGSSEQQAGPIYLGDQGERIGAPMTVEEIPPMKLDLFATGTPGNETDDGQEPPGLSEQPFPGDEATYRVVHIANGRAMVADDAGLWVVQVGSLLPDNSTVARIEQQSGKWVLVTSSDRILELSGN